MVSDVEVVICLFFWFKINISRNIKFSIIFYIVFVVFEMDIMIDSYIRLNRIFRMVVMLVICRYFFLVIENFLFVLIFIIFWKIDILFLLLVFIR